MNISLNENLKVIGKDQILFKEGNEATHFYLVKSGAILCLKNSKDRLVPIFNAGPQKILGEEAALTGMAHAYSAVAVEEAEVVEIEAKVVKKLIESGPQWMGNLLRTLGERATDTSAAIAEHRIFSDELSSGANLAPEEENRIKKMLDQ